MQVNDLSRFGGAKILFKAIISSIFTLVFYLAALFGNFSDPITLIFALLFGFSSLLLVLSIGHDAAHGTLAPSRKFNDIVQMFAFSLVGTDSYLWKVRHVKAHHFSPNVDNFDVDVSENGILRLSPFQKYYPHYRFQHLYAPLVFGLINIHTMLFYDFRCLLTGRLDNVKLNNRNWKMLSSFMFIKVNFVLVMFVIPYAVMDRPWWHIAIGAFVVSFVDSIIYATLFIGTHHGEGIHYPRADERNVVQHGWAYHQVVTALDWLPLSKLANFFAGGSNTHVAHHLFPNISHIHYVQITKIIQEEAKRFGIPYKQSSFIGMVASHYRHLKKMGSRSDLQVA
jgi:linoleoyl-CoA desaturase